MSLKTTPVSKCLDKKLLIMGFEIPDLLAVFFLLAVLNFLFGSSGNALLLVWLPSITLAVILRYGKRGKPENYLLHWMRYQISSGAYSAFKDATTFELPPTIKRRAS